MESSYPRIAAKRTSARVAAAVAFRTSRSRKVAGFLSLSAFGHAILNQLAQARQEMTKTVAERVSSGMPSLYTPDFFTL